MRFLGKMYILDQSWQLKKSFYRVSPRGGKAQVKTEWVSRHFRQSIFFLTNVKILSYPINGKAMEFRRIDTIKKVPSFYVACLRENEHLFRCRS